VNPFTEAKDGKWSSSRLLGAGIVVAVVIVLLWATAEGEWETARTLSLELLLLAGALYGINRFSQPKQEVT